MLEAAELADEELLGDPADRQDEERRRHASVLGRVRDLLLAVAAGLDLPPNPLDGIIERLGGSKAVAELTGRKSAMVGRGGGHGFSRRGLGAQG